MKERGPDWSQKTYIHFWSLSEHKKDVFLHATSGYELAKGLYTWTGSFLLKKNNLKSLNVNKLYNSFLKLMFANNQTRRC